LPPAGGQQLRGALDYAPAKRLAATTVFFDAMRAKNYHPNIGRISCNIQASKSLFFCNSKKIKKVNAKINQPWRKNPSIRNPEHNPEKH
jgi:hypothetical protein